MPGVVVHHLGPVLCYSFGQAPHERCHWETYGINPGDVVIFCLGEIDCRCHVHNHVTPTKPYQVIIDNIVDSYFKAIKKLTKQCDVKVCVYNVPPPVHTHDTENDPHYPFRGTDEERKAYYVYFNERLRDMCYEYNYTFFNVYDAYADPSGFLRKELSDNRVHIANPKYIIEFLNSNLMQ
jgi:hypothetical protein